MAVRNFNDAEKQKLIQIISQGSQVLSEVDDLKSGLKDTVKAIAEELELKPALINKAMSVAHRGNYAIRTFQNQFIKSGIFRGLVVRSL